MIALTQGEMHPDAIPVIRWFQRYRRSGSVRCEELVPYPLSQEKLAEIAALTPMAYRESLKTPLGAARHEADLAHRDEFVPYFQSQLWLQKNWFLSESDLLEIKVPSRSQCRVDALYLMEKWVQSEKVLE